MKGFVLATVAGQALASHYANVSFVNELWWLYNDSGTSATMDIQVYLPKPTDTATEYVVGSIALNSEYKKHKILVMGSEVGLADPVSFEWLWDDRDTRGDYDVTFVRPLCPPGYSSVSDFALLGHCSGDDCLTNFQQLQKDKRVKIKPCIDDKMLLDCPQDLAPLIYNDKGSRGSYDVSVFALVGPPGNTVDGYGAAANIGNLEGFWRASKGYPETLGGVFKCVNPHVFLESVWSSTAKWGPGVNGEQSFVTGSTFSSSEKLTEVQKSSLASSLSVSVGAGFYGVDVGSTATISADYTEETSQEFATAASKSVTVSCKAPSCDKYNYTTNELRIYQWSLNARKVEGEEYFGQDVQVTTCLFFCGTTRILPKCPPESCFDDRCQECCMKDNLMVPCHETPIFPTNPCESVAFGVHANSHDN
eukprot:CAMPEP_0203748442 /NCGR_PEP_ID=MMETSP0098-20131031/3327_1 /ASSEMBLY_ACC=CAM_ASM_000208 /TAXON_ID=96639 /ORGANISM=" , Strain NY0313808BC1" /LENGTH=419 /DNA_ID=CAMNT_0050637191 /DNA_START=374 /DNA_END=1633 /DNA_ORIENTATION=-